MRAVLRESGVPEARHDVVVDHAHRVVDLTGHRPGCEREPSFTPSGHWIVFRLQSETLHSLWKMRPDGSDRTRIRRLPFVFGGLEWGLQPS